MKIKELLGEAGAVATIKDYKPGQTLSFSDPTGSTMTTIDLKKNPMAVKPDEQGNLTYDPTPDTQAEVPGQSTAPEIKPGAQIQIDTATTEQSEDEFEAPPMPNIDGLEAGQSKDLGDGKQVTLKQDGTVSYRGGFGEYIYDNNGTAITYNSANFSGLSKSKDFKTGQTSKRYSVGPLTTKQNSDGSSDTTARLGDTTARIQQNPIGVKTLTAQGPDADAINSVNASAERKGVDPAKFAKFQKQNSESMDESAYITALAKRISNTETKSVKTSDKSVFDIKRLAGL